MSSPTLLGAIHAVIDPPAGTLQVYNDEPPEGSDPATGYAVIEDLREPQEPLTFEGVYSYRGTFAVVVWGEGTATVEANAAAIKALLQVEGAIQVTGRNPVTCYGITYAPELDRTRSTDAKRVTFVRTEYLAWTTGV